MMEDESLQDIVRRLNMRWKRLIRLSELDAPDPVISKEIDLIEEAMSMLIARTGTEIYPHSWEEEANTWQA